MPGMGRYNDEAKDHSETGSPADREGYLYDGVFHPLVLQEEKELDYHNYAAGTRGEEGARRKNWKFDRSPTWHDTKDSDKVNWGSMPQGTPERSDG